LNQAVWFQALCEFIVGFVREDTTLTVPPSTQLHKFDNWGNSVIDSIFSGGKQVANLLLLVLCYRNQRRFVNIYMMEH